MRPGRWILALALPVLLVAAHTVYWRIVAQQVAVGWEAWVAERRAAGWTVTAGMPVSGGWPLAGTLHVPGLSLQGGDREVPGGLAWTAASVVLRVNLWQPRVLQIRAKGAQRLRLGDRPEIPYTADRLQLKLRLDPEVPPHAADIEAEDLRAGLPLGADTTASLTIGALKVHADLHAGAAQGEAALSIRARADRIGLPPGFTWALGSRVAAISVATALNGPVPGAGSLPARAAEWRDGGGTLAVERFGLDWGPLHIAGAATLALDAQLQPMGAAAIRIAGYAAALDALATNGAITRQSAIAARAVLTLIAQGSPDAADRPQSGPVTVDVPLTLQDRRLSMRQVPLTRFPALMWPEQ